MNSLDYGAKLDLGPLKALFLTRGMPPPFIGGAGIYYYHIFRRFPPGEITVFTEKPRQQPSKKDLAKMQFIRREYIRPNIPSAVRFPRLRRVKGLSNLDWLMMIIPWGVELLNFCRMDKPDVIYIGQLFPVGLLGLMTRRLFSLPFIVFVHGEELTIAKHHGGYSWMIMLKVLKKAFRVVANSTFTREQIIDCGIGSERVVAITPRVDTDLYHPFYDTDGLKRELKITNEKILLSVGRLTARKGHSKVICLLPRLMATVGKTKYVIVGSDVGEGPKLKKMAENLGVESSVVFTGVVPAEDLPKYYCLCDVMVLANYERSDQDTEGFGMVFLEANACGKPVIGGLAGGTSDAVVHGQTGLLVDASDEDALETALLSLLTDKQYSLQLGENGKRRVLSQFRWEAASSEVRRLGLMAKREYHASAS